MPDMNIRLEGASNFRDIGGYIGMDGRRVRHGRLFRSDTLSRLTERDLDAMATLGVRLVCDLRSASERTLHPSRWSERERPEFLHLDVNADLRASNQTMLEILRADPTGHGAEAMMLESYRAIPIALQRHLGDLFQRIDSGNGVPLIFHCSAGKDRTGVLSAVLLLALGVSREDVIKDYLLTRRFVNVADVKATVTEITAHLLGSTPPPDVVSAIAAVREAYLDRALCSIEESHGSVIGYLDSCGVDGGLLDRVRERLLHPAAPEFGGHPPCG